MAEKHIYICDKCGKEWDAIDKSEQPVAIGFALHFGQSNISYGRPGYRDTKAMWCRSCVMSLGISEPANDKDKQVVPEKPLSIEEKILELLEHLGIYPHKE